MKIILQEDVANVGNLGDMVNVSDGYARNYLIPNGMAVIALDGNMRQLKHQQKLIAKKRAVKEEAAKLLSEKLSGTSISFKRQVAEGEETKIFGSVTNRDIASALGDMGIDVDRRKVSLDEPIRALGAFSVPVTLFGGASAEVKVFVVQE